MTNQRGFSGHVISLGFFLFFVNEERSHAQSAENFFRKKPTFHPFLPPYVVYLTFHNLYSCLPFLYIVYPTLFRLLAYQGNTVNYFFYVFQVGVRFYMKRRQIKTYKLRLFANKLNILHQRYCLHLWYFNTFYMMFVSYS